MAGSLVILTGASGSGKTTIAEAIEARNPDLVVFRFDSIGVPSLEVMATFGTDPNPGAAWQRAMTFRWMERIAPLLLSGRSVLFEGQMRISFVQEALTTNFIENAQLICVECDDQTRTHRLTHHRQQPELANEDMMGWSRYLHREAESQGLEIMDTTKLSVAQSAEKVLSHLRS